MIHVEIWHQFNKRSKRGYWRLVGSFASRAAAERCHQLYRDCGYEARIA